MADKQAKDKALEMLTKYLDGAAPFITHVCVGIISRKGSHNHYRRRFFTIDEGRIVDLTMYVANLYGLRLDSQGNAMGRPTAQEIVTEVERQIARAVKKYDL